MLFSIPNAKFYNEFICKVSAYTENIYQYSLNLQHIPNFDKTEMAEILLINTMMFENFYAFETLVDKKLINSACSCFRNQIENFRLLLALIQNSEFRKQYTNNQNIEFRTVYDSAFMQGKVLNLLSKNSKDPIWGNINKNYIKNSTFSELHSELSKIVHGINKNILFAINLEENNRIFLGVGVSEMNVGCQLEIKKLYESELILTIDYMIGITSLVEKYVDKTILTEQKKRCKGTIPNFV